MVTNPFLIDCNSYIHHLRSVKAIESICMITMDHTPFDSAFSNHIKNLAMYILAGGIVFNILEVCRVMYFKQIINFDLLFNPKYVTQSNLIFVLNSAS